MRAAAKASIAAKPGEPWLSTKAMFFVFFVSMAVLWGGISLLFYLEVP